MLPLENKASYELATSSNRETKLSYIESMKNTLKEYSNILSETYKTSYNEKITQMENFLKSNNELENAAKNIKGEPTIKQRKEKIDIIRKNLETMLQNKIITGPMENEIKTKLNKEENNIKQEELQLKIMEYIKTKIKPDYWFANYSEEDKEDVIKNIDELNKYYDLIESQEIQIEPAKKEELKETLAEKYKKYIKDISKKLDTDYSIASAEEIIPVIKGDLENNKRFEKYFTEREEKKEITDKIKLAEENIKYIKTEKENYSKVSFEAKKNYLYKRFERYGWAKDSPRPEIRENIVFVEQLMNYGENGKSYERFAEEHTIKYVMNKLGHMTKIQSPIYPIENHTNTKQNWDSEQYFSAMNIIDNFNDDLLY